MSALVRRLLPPGLTTPVAVLRVALLALPCAAMALALPARPDPVVTTLVVLCSLRWAHTPDHAAGAAALLLVAGWWAAHGVVDWRVLVVGVLLVAAHVVATVLALGPSSLALDPHVVRLWLGRSLLALLPMPVAWVSVRGLDAGLAPSWLWITAAVATGALLVATARMTQPEAE